MKTVLSLGGNVGNVADAIRHVAASIPKFGLREVELSPLYVTSPVGCEPGTPDFINAVIIGNWNGEADSLLELCHQFESKAGRPEIREKNSPRTLDIDIILFGNEVRTDEKLVLPHPEATKRLYVLQPLCDIDPDIVFPDTKMTVFELLKKLLFSLPANEQVIKQC